MQKAVNFKTCNMVRGALWELQNLVTRDVNPYYQDRLTYIHIANQNKNNNNNNNNNNTVIIIIITIMNNN